MDPSKCVFWSGTHELGEKESSCCPEEEEANKEFGT